MTTSASRITKVLLNQFLTVFRLNEWLEITNDPWRCAPHAVLQDAGPFKNHPQCMTLGQTKE